MLQEKGKCMRYFSRIVDEVAFQLCIYGQFLHNSSFKMHLRELNLPKMSPETNFLHYENLYPHLNQGSRAVLRKLLLLYLTFCICSFIRLHLYLTAREGHDLNPFPLKYQKKCISTVRAFCVKYECTLVVRIKNLKSGYSA